MTKFVHYNMDEIDSKGASINLIWGERSGGKSYQVKHKKGVLPYFNDSVRYIASYKNKEKVIKSSLEKGHRFILMRRWKEEISSNFIESYFSDVDIVKITEGKYNMITMYRKELYLSFYDTDTHKTKKGEKIGYAVSLSTEQNYAGGSYLDVYDIIFEEFMARGGRSGTGNYLPNEPDKLMNFFSTIDRKRNVVKLWLVGNTITRVCPYIEEWGLFPIISKQEQGTINTLWIPTGDKDDDGNEIEVKLAIEHCKSTGRSSYVIGKHKSMLNKGEWQSDPQPKLPKSYNEYKKLYMIYFNYKGFIFGCDLLQDRDTYDLVWFIYPSKRIKKNKLVFSDIIKTSKLWQRDIYNPSIKNRTLKMLLDTFKENKIFYATDLCGTEFKQSIDFIIRK